MKRIATITTMIAAILTLGSVRNTASSQQVGVSITYQDFYDGLSPYGEWMDYPEYGYVWRPSGIHDFVPYSTGGRWVWTDEYDWMWASDYDWGWAPFHYGRWFHDPFYGWMWVPGYEWSPAWVAWRDGGDYYGWAPIRPGIHIGVNFNFGSYNPPVDYWSFAPRRHITSIRLGSYIMPRRQNVTIINNTTIINNYGRRGGNNTFVTGPRRAEVERYTGRIRPINFREANAPGRSRVRGNQVTVYRPQINRDNNRNFAPRQFNRVENNRANTGRAANNNAAANNRFRNERTNGNNREGANNRPNRQPNAGGAIDRNQRQRNEGFQGQRNDRTQGQQPGNNGRVPSIDNRVRNDRNVRDNRMEQRQPNSNTSPRVFNNDRSRNEATQQRNEAAQRQRNEASQRQRNEASQRQRNEGVQRQRNEGVQRQRNEGVQRQRNEGVQRQRNEGVQRQRNEGVQRQRNEGAPRPQGGNNSRNDRRRVQ